MSASRSRERRWTELERAWCELGSDGRGAEGRHWQTDASCRDRVELPWTSETDLLSPQDIERLDAVCASCRVAVECADFAGRAHVTSGWWAGSHRGRGDETVWQDLLPFDGAA